MNHLNDQTAPAAISEIIETIVPADAVSPALSTFARLVELTLETNQRMNLTADREPALFWVRHVEDALRAALCLCDWISRLPPGAPILDVGSGGGIPGLIWAILWPGHPVTLLESRGKRARFIGRAAADLGLVNVRVVAERAEAAAHAGEYRERFALVTARALAPLPTLAELTLPFAQVGGLVAAIKSAAIEAELQSARAALDRLGSAGDQVRSPGYARSDGKQCTVCLLPKIAPTPAAYPRREGIPKASPIV